MRLDTSFACNTVIWISSVSEVEMGPTNRMAEDLDGICNKYNIAFKRKDVTTRVELISLLQDLEVRTREHGVRPILVFDMHGSEVSGLHLRQTGECLEWKEVGKLLRDINISAGNNLCVIGAACFSLRAITPTKLDQAAPFFVLLAPETEVNVGFLEENIPPFFDHLFSSGGLDEAYSRYLSDEFKYFHCEKMLFIVIAKYVKSACMGKSVAKRREYLLTEIFMQGLERTPENIRDIRAKLKNGLRPTQALLDRYSQTFLVGRSCSFTMDQLQRVLREGDA